MAFIFFFLGFWFVCISNFDSWYFSWTSGMFRAELNLSIAFFSKGRIWGRYGLQIDIFKKNIRFMAGGFHSRSKFSKINLLVKYI